MYYTRLTSFLFIHLSPLSQAAAAAPGGVAPDVVISCPPSDPPYALLSLCHCLANHFPISCHVHVHSSVTEELPEELVQFWKGIPQSRDPVLRITLLWKSGESRLSTCVCVCCDVLVLCYK